MPDYSSLVERISGDGSTAWVTHFNAVREKMAGGDVIVMSVGDPDFATPEPIVNAAVNALQSGDTHYTPILGKPRLRQAIADELMRVSGSQSYKVAPENIMVTAGTQNALFAASLCLIDAGDEVIALDPMYVTYEATWRIANGVLVKTPTPRQNGFRPDIDLIRQAITPETKAIVFATPNNPTGVVMTREELQEIADLAIEHDLWVVSDEVYAAQVFDGHHFSIAALPGMAERTVTTGSLSKSQAMPGWRVGWISGPQDLIQSCDNLGLAMLYGVPGFIQEAAIEGLTTSRGEMETMLAIYQKRRDLAGNLLSNQPLVDVLVPQAGMFILMDVSRTGMTANEFASKLYESKKVSVLDGAAFGEPTANCVRISFTINESDIAEGCNRIIEFLNEEVES